MDALVTRLLDGAKPEFNAFTVKMRAEGTEGMVMTMKM